MKILVACEESQAVTKELRNLGHEAYSCDIVECSGGHYEWHIKGDCIPLLNGNCSFKTMDGTEHTINGKWDILIAHPPCTYLSNAGAARLFKKIDGVSYVIQDRVKNGIEARLFFQKFLDADCDKIAIENPIPTAIFCLPPYTQVIQPYEHGHPFSKKTCLWLKNLPTLTPTEIVEPIGSWVSGGSKKPDGSPRENKGETFRDSKTKSKTFQGIAKAMAEQFGGDIRDGEIDGITKWR